MAPVPLNEWMDGATIASPALILTTYICIFS